MRDTGGWSSKCEVNGIAREPGTDREKETETQEVCEFKVLVLMAGGYFTHWQ